MIYKLTLTFVNNEFKRWLSWTVLKVLFEIFLLKSTKSSLWVTIRLGLHVIFKIPDRKIGRHGCDLFDYLYAWRHLKEGENFLGVAASLFRVQQTFTFYSCRFYLKLFLRRVLNFQIFSALQTSNFCRHRRVKRLHYRRWASR